MLALITALKDRTIEGDDTGTYADGAIPVPMTELRPERGPDRGRREFQRDYGHQRSVMTDVVGYV